MSLYVYIIHWHSISFHIIRISFHIIPSIPSWLHLHSIAAVLDAHLRSQAQPPQSWWGTDLIDLQESKISADSFFPIYTYQVWQSCFVKSLEPCKESSGSFFWSPKHWHISVDSQMLHCRIWVVRLLENPWLMATGGLAVDWSIKSSGAISVIKKQCSSMWNSFNVAHSCIWK